MRRVFVVRTQHDLGELTWRLAGFTPNYWLGFLGAESLCDNTFTEIASVPAQVPGSVQQALLDAGVIPDWNRQMHCHDCEWVENRHWVYEAAIPDKWIADGRIVRLVCLGLDYSGWVYVNDSPVSEFRGGHAPCGFDLGPALRAQGNKLRIIFDMPPRYLGYTGFTSKFTDWKVRFSYSWDWMVRLVTIGIWDDLSIEVSDGLEIERLSAYGDADGDRGILKVSARLNMVSDATVTFELTGDGGLIRTETVAADALASDGLTWDDLPVRLWWPNNQGDQPLYTLECVLRDGEGAELDRATRRIGFRNVRWEQCEGAPDGADPWLCLVNDRPVFIQGINWTPIRPNFHDLGAEEYRSRIELYRNMGINLFRVWGGGILEKELFYNLCDEMGIMVWQEFPMSSSTFENWPSEDAKAIEEMVGMAASYIERRGFHPSLIVWCGGNELHRAVGEGADRLQVPVDLQHPMMHALDDLVRRTDQGRRFVATSPTGPRYYAKMEEYGKGLHWDVHGPWRPEAGLDLWREFWSADDALFRSEVGSPGASPVEILDEYCAPGSFEKPSARAPVFRRQFDGWWWAERPQFDEDHGREPESVGEFVAWSQARQAEALRIASTFCKDRFPRCGGIILWMGHDCFPCSSNTSIVDYHGNPKPAVSALRQVFAP